MDPDFYTEDVVFCDNDLDEICNDLFDDHEIDSTDFDKRIEQDIEDSLYTNADQLALAMGFGEFIVNGKEVYDVDENTDRENWRKAMKLYPLQGQYNSDNISTFEQYINEITSGQRKGPWVKH
ncbi:hypothetical protein KAU51_03535 [Candidatus Parcubacteria bacterium]|nr:hypothetical protein [Candidatus Parcubacteria bacterium]